MLDSIIRFSIRNKLIVGLMTLALVIWGVWSALRLPIDAVPDITNNQVQIITTSPTLAGQEVEQLVTFPIEQSLANLPGVEEVRSISRFGLSVVTVVFSEETDIYFARQQVSESLMAAQQEIPPGIGVPEMAPVSTGLGEVYQYILRPKAGSEHKYSLRDLREMQDWIVARQLNGTPGIAEVNSFGGELKQYEVAVDPSKLLTMGISISDIFTALERNNENTGGAYIDKRPNAYFIRGIGLVTSLEDVRSIAVREASETGSAIYVRDVAEVRIGSAIRYGALSVDGQREAVGGIVMMLKGENSHEVVQRVKARIKTIQSALPEDVVIEPYLDRTDLVGRAISTVERNLIEGALIVIFVLVLFLGNLRAGLIVASAIPLSMLFALGMMHLFGVSANLMSLGAIDFGLIVDGAVIIVEATLHHLGLRSGRGPLSRSEMDEEVYQSASRIRSSAAFGEIIILIVYIPILTLVGIEGKMFRPMAQTVGFAILGALILSLTYIPMMCALCLRRDGLHRETLSDRMMRRLQGWYAPALERAIRLRRQLVLGTFALLGGSLWLFSSMGGEFIPQLEEGDYAFQCVLPQGSSLSQSLETSMHAARLMLEFDEVRTVIGKTGSAEVPTDPMPPEATDMMVILHPQSTWTSGRSYQELGDAIEQRLRDIPGIHFERSQPIQMRFNELMTGVRQDVAVKIFGEHLDTLARYAQAVGRVIATIEGATDPQVEQVSGLPQINVTYDRVRLANYGLSVQAVNDVLSTAFAGRSTGTVLENERRFDLVVRLDSTRRGSIDDVARLTVPLASGEQIPLYQVANIGYQVGPAQISREDGKRRIVVGFNVSGRDVRSVVSDLQARLADEVQLPTGYYFTYGGQFENLQKGTDRLAIAVPVSLLLIFVLLYFTFGSLRYAGLIFTAIPMSAIGGVLALSMRGMPFSISAGIGFIALFGVAVLNGIVLISTFNQLRRDGTTDLLERVRRGTEMRLRPVLMTALVASLGFLPMALSTSAGAEVQKPLATVVIGGLVSATLLTLFILPLLYMMFESPDRPTPSGSRVGTAALLVLALLSPTLSPAATASEPSVPHTPHRYTLDSILSIALERNGHVAAAEHQLRATALGRRMSYDLPKLQLSSQLGQYSSSEQDQSFTLEQTIPFPTTFGARHRLASAEHASAAVSRDIAIEQLRTSIRRQYDEIQYLMAERRLRLYLDSMYSDFVEIASVRHRSGDTSAIDATTARTKRGQVRLELQSTEARLAQSYAALAALMNSSEPFVIAPEYEPREVLLDEHLLSSSAERHLSVRALDEQTHMARRSKQLVLHEALPDLTLGYTNQSLVGTHSIGGREVRLDKSYRFQYFTLGIAIPLNLRAEAAKANQWEQRRRSYSIMREQQRRAIESQLQQALVALRQSRSEWQYYLREALPNSQALISATLVSYRAGEVSYIEYLYTLETVAEIQSNYLKSIRQVNDATTTLLSLLNQ